jgi:hypothetical protein
LFIGILINQASSVLKKSGEPNNGMHPTRKGAALIFYSGGGLVMPGVGLLLFTLEK